MFLVSSPFFSMIVNILCFYVFSTIRGLFSIKSYWNLRKSHKKIKSQNGSTLFPEIFYVRDFFPQDFFSAKKDFISEKKKFSKNVFWRLPRRTQYKTNHYCLELESFVDKTLKNCSTDPKYLLEIRGKVN